MPTRDHESTDRLLPGLFLAAGGLVAVHAAIRGVEAFTASSTPPDVFAPLGYLLATIGLLVFSRSSVREHPGLMAIGRVSGSVLALGWMFFAIWALGAWAGALEPAVEFLPGVAYLGLYGAMVVTYSVFGLAAARAEVPSRTVGILLLIPAVLIALLVVGMGVIGNAAVGAFLVGTAQSLTHLAIGGALMRSSATVVSDPSTGEILAD